MAANRDEFYNRPSKAADFWGASNEILSGKPVHIHLRPPVKLFIKQQSFLKLKLTQISEKLSCMFCVNVSVRI